MQQSQKPKIIRTATIALSLNVLLKGQLAFLNRYFNVIAVSGYDNNLKELSERENVDYRSVQMQRKIAPLKDLIALWQLYRCFKKEKPTIVHSITPKAGLLSMTAAFFAGVPIRIHTFTGLIFPYKSGMLQKLLIVMDKILCKMATNIYPEGNGVKNDLIQYKITNKSLKVIANGNVNGIDTAYFNPELFNEKQKQKLKSDLNITEDDFVFLFVGRLVGDKGINELVSAFQQINNTFKHTKLLLVGPKEADDPVTSETENIINANPAIITTGFQSDVRPFMAIANALTFPSYREGFPNVVIQAGAMNLPCIVTDISGCNEIIINKKNGLIIPKQNTNELYNAMQEIVSDKSLLQSLSQNARKMIVTKYEQSIVWKALLDEYNNLLHK